MRVSILLGQVLPTVFAAFLKVTCLMASAVKMKFRKIPMNAHCLQSFVIDESDSEAFDAEYITVFHLTYCTVKFWL